MSQTNYLSPVFPAKQVFKAIITEVDSDLNIYFRVEPENGTQPIRRVIEAIENLTIQPAHSDDQFAIGKACIAKSAANKSWQRAIIEKIDNSNYHGCFTVRFVDNGTVEMLNKSSLSGTVIMPEVPKLALRGYLYKLKHNESTKTEFYQRFRECLLDKVVIIRWENFLAQLFPMQITIKIPGQGIFKAVPEEQLQTNVSDSPRRVMYSLEAMRENLSKTRRQFGSMSLNGTVCRNDSSDEMANEMFGNVSSNRKSEISKTENTRSVGQTSRAVVRDAANKESITGSSFVTAAASTSSTSASASSAFREGAVLIHQEEKRLFGLPEDVIEVSDAITKSPFQNLYPELSSNVFYPVIICEHVAENYCFLQTMPIHEASPNELQITIRHTMFISLIENMRNDVNNFNLVSEYPPFGLPVCAQFDDEEWYRAVVMYTLQGSRKSKVLYVDYGNTREVKYSQLRELPVKYITALPAHAFLVKLCNIRPSRNQPWDVKHSEKLKQTLADITDSLVAIFCQSGYPLAMDIYEASPYSDRVPCKHPLQILVDSGEFEFVKTPIV